VRSIYEQALGPDFTRLHPLIQRRFGFSSRDRVGCVGRGVMDQLWRGPFYTLPFLYVGTWRRIMFPERGENVPFTIENYAFIDPFGRETVTWVRTFAMPAKSRRFDAYMIYSGERGRIVDYLGTHQHVAVDLTLSVSDVGGLRLRSGEQRFYEGRIGFRFPLILSGVAEVHEWFDESVQRYRIEVSVTNRKWGPLFGYRGQFSVDWIDVTPTGLPEHLMPKQFERRE
jgi:hypothetical protein